MSSFKVDIYPSDQIISLPQLCDLLEIPMPNIDVTSQDSKNKSINNFITYLKKKVKSDNTIKIIKSNERPLLNKELLFEYKQELLSSLDNSLLSNDDKLFILKILVNRESNSLEGYNLNKLSRQLKIVFKKFKIPGPNDLISNFLDELVDRKILRVKGNRIGIRIPDDNFDILSDNNYIVRSIYEKYNKQLMDIRTFDSGVNYLIQSVGMFNELELAEAAQKAGSIIAHYVSTGKMG